MKFQNLSVKRLFGRVAMGLALSMSGITIALFFVMKQTAVLLTGGVLLLCALVGIFVLTQAFGTRLSQFTADLCQTLDHMIAGNEAPQRPEDSETQLIRLAADSPDKVGALRLGHGLFQQGVRRHFQIAHRRFHLMGNI